MSEAERFDLGDDPRHPSRYAYVHLRCRCDGCTDENRLHVARLRRTGNPPRHGLSGYDSYGCRCDVCKAAKSVSNAAYRTRKAAAS